MEYISLIFFLTSHKLVFGRDEFQKERIPKWDSYVNNGMKNELFVFI